MGRDQGSKRALFVELIPEIEKAVRTVSCRKRLDREERQELYSSTMLKIIQDDFAVLRSYQGRSRWSTYFTIVAQRVLLDQWNRRLGKWRPSAAARRLGLNGIALDRLLNRDGLSGPEAVDQLIRCGARESRQTLYRWVRRLPRRSKRRFVPLEQATQATQATQAEPLEEKTMTSELHRTLTHALRDLSEQERRLLWLRFGKSWTIPRIAKNLGAEPRRLYREFQSIFRRLRRRLEGAGLSWRDVHPFWNPAIFELDALAGPRPKTRRAKASTAS